MTREESIERLKECQKCTDIEMAHIDADDALAELLLTLGYADVVAEWEKVGKWYA